MTKEARNPKTEFAEGLFGDLHILSVFRFVMWFSLQPYTLLVGIEATHLGISTTHGTLSGIFACSFSHTMLVGREASQFGKSGFPNRLRKGEQEETEKTELEGELAREPEWNWPRKGTKEHKKGGFFMILLQIAHFTLYGPTKHVGGPTKRVGAEKGMHSAACHRWRLVAGPRRIFIKFSCISGRSRAMPASTDGEMFKILVGRAAEGAGAKLVKTI